MTTAAYEAGLAEFNRSFNDALAAKPDANWRAGGRKTKALPNGEDANWWLANGTAMVTAYYRWRSLNPNISIWYTPNGTPAIELEVNMRLEDDTMVKGYIDRVFQDFDSGELLIVDLKTGKNTPGPIQLAVYNLALQHTFGLTAKFGAYWMAREGTLDTIHDLTRLPPNMVSRWFRDVNKSLNAEIFVPHVGMMSCGWCGVKDHCYVHADGTYQPDFDSDIHKAQESEEV